MRPFAPRLQTRAARLCGAAAMAAASLVSQPAWAEDEGLSTDRPDFVESSNVVGKGVLQIETSFAHERDRSGGVKTSVRSTPTLLRYGLSEALELRLESDGLLRQSVTDAGGTARARGTGDASLGLKWHVRDGDEDSGKPALALLAHLDMDSGTAAFRAPGKVPSLRLVAEWELPGDASFGVMPGMAYAVSDTTGQRYWSGILAATYSRPLVGALRGFVELAGQTLRSKRNGGNVVTFDAGLTSTACAADAL
jgi:hypothetical protein